MIRRKFIAAAGASLFVPALPRFSTAQASYPSRPVHVVVGFPPGGVSDISARLVSQVLSDYFHQQFIVENRVGAGGTLATEAVIRAAPDGYALLATGNNDGLNATLYDNLSYNYIRDIAPVGGFTQGMGVIVVPPTSPAKTLAEFTAQAKANPGRLNVGSGGVGSSSHVFLELFKSMAGVNIVHVPYRGEALALTDLLGGQLQAVFPTMPPAIEHIKSGKLRALAVTGKERFNLLPDVPTIAETLPGYEGSFWIGVAAPKNTPAPIIEQLNRAINVGLEDSSMKRRLAELGADGFSTSPAGFGKYIADYTQKWAGVIRDANIKL
jgi:tripartite-type tricarboxylate transporter receptor subunit TctC